MVGSPSPLRAAGRTGSPAHQSQVLETGSYKPLGDPGSISLSRPWGNGRSRPRFLPFLNTHGTQTTGVFHPLPSLDRSLGYETRKGHLPEAVAVRVAQPRTQTLIPEGTQAAAPLGCAGPPEPRMLFHVERSDQRQSLGEVYAHEADCVSLTSWPPQMGCDSPHERPLDKCHSRAVAPLYSIPHIPWSFPARKGDNAGTAGVRRNRGH